MIECMKNKGKQWYKLKNWSAYNQAPINLRGYDLRKRWFGTGANLDSLVIESARRNYLMHLQNQSEEIF